MRQYFNRLMIAIIAAISVLGTANAQTPNITGNEFQTQTIGKTVPGFEAMCLNSSNQAVPIGPDCANPVPVTPSNPGAAGSTTANSTIAVTNTYQLALAASANRKGCFFQNQGTHNMSVALNVGGTSPAILAPSQQMYCGGAGIVIGDPIYVTGTAGDAYIIWSQ